MRLVLSRWIPSTGIIAVAVITACGAKSTQDERDTATKVGVHGVENQQLDAESQFKRYLRLGVATHRPADLSDLLTCDDQFLYEDIRWVADSRVLSVAVRGDSAFASAVFTVVARQVESGKEWVATLGIRTDTGRFVLVKNAETQGRWRVCGESAEKFGITMVGVDIRWLPTGASAAKARQIVDSIRTSRGLELIR
jgi:hypothetical protein